MQKSDVAVNYMHLLHGRNYETPLSIKQQDVSAVISPEATSYWQQEDEQQGEEWLEDAAYNLAS